MIKKSIIPMLLAICFSFTVAFSGCSDNQSTNIVQSEQSYPSALIWNDICYFNSVATVPKEQVDEKLGEIKKQVKPMPQKSGEANSLPVGTQLFSIKGEDSKEAIAIQEGNEYHRATINKNSSEKSIVPKHQFVQPNTTSLQFTEDEAIAKVVKNHPEFPDKAGMKEDKEKIGGPEGAKATVMFETKVEKKVENTYTVTLTKTWEMKVNGKTPVSFWKYDVTPEKVILVKEDTTGEDLISIIK